MPQQQQILVIGAGSWGTALAILLSQNQHSTLLWGHDQEQMARLQAERENCQFLPGLRFPSALTPILDLQPYLTQVAHVLIVVPSEAFHQVLQMIAPTLPATTPVSWGTKGLEPNSCQPLHQVAFKLLGEQRPLAVISGPTFAKEVATGLPTAMTVAATQQAYADTLADLLRSDNCRVYTCTDMIGVQVGAAAKNVIAIAAGIADGLGFGANTRAALITRGLNEIMKLGVALGGHKETFMGLTGLGDLLLTCTDDQSRNRRFGYALAQGYSVEHALRNIGQVVEGLHSVVQIVKLAQQMQIDMPISEQVSLVVQGLCTPEQAVHNLLSREPKAENA